jgi:hypothetical protein
MELPFDLDLDELLCILILRVLNYSEDNTASTLHIGKVKVVSGERWFRCANYNTVLMVCDQQAIKRVTARELASRKEIDPQTLVKAAQLTTDDILRRYHTDYLPKMELITTGFDKPSHHLAEVAKTHQLATENTKSKQQVAGEAQTKQIAGGAAIKSSTSKDENRLTHGQQPYDRSPRQIQGYIAKMKSRVPARAVPSPKLTEGDRNLVLADPVASRLYQEHQKGMIRLVERLSADLEPHLSSFRLRSLEDRGTHSKSIWQSPGSNRLSLTWEVEEGGSIYLHYGLELAEDTGTKIMRGYFQQHLHSSSYLWLMEDDVKGIKKWKQLAGEELKNRTLLLRNIDRAVKKLTRKSLVDPNRMDSAGPSTWFSDSIWAAVLDGLYITLDYKVEPVDIGLFKAQYGANFIGLTETKEEGGQYVEWHKNLMAKFKRSSMVKAIDQLKKDRELVTKGIRDVLTKIVVDKHIPGKCDYEFCR